MMAKVVNFPLDQSTDQDNSYLNTFKECVITPKVKSEIKSYEISKSYPGVSTALEDINKWSFDSFLLADATEHRPLLVLGQTLFMKYDLLNAFRISPSTVGVFLNRLEDGYGLNPFHNSVHATNVTQTMHYFLWTSNMMKYLTNVEIFASLFAALIHDYNHNGKTNKFLIMTRADRALLYNDRSVQENHHLAAAFFLLKDRDCNILQNLTLKQYRLFRTIVIDMVLQTDMAFHFQMLKHMKNRMRDPSPITERDQVMSFVLHTCDLSYAIQMWTLHVRWTELKFEEFFQQGEKEKKLGFPCSRMCDKQATAVPESQLHFLDFIVEPLITICSDLIERILSENNYSEAENLECIVKCIDKPWLECIRENKIKWRKRIAKKEGTFLFFIRLLF